VTRTFLKCCKWTILFHISHFFQALSNRSVSLSTCLIVHLISSNDARKNTWTDLLWKPSVKVLRNILVYSLLFVWKRRFLNSKMMLYKNKFAGYLVWLWNMFPYFKKPIKIVQKILYKCMAIKSKNYTRNLKCYKTGKFDLWHSPKVVRIVKCKGLKFVRHEAAMRWQRIHINVCCKKNFLKTTWKAQDELYGTSKS
jgi:hypothetical protein